MPLIWPIDLPVLVIQDFCSIEFGHLHNALDLVAATSEGASVIPSGMTIVAVQDGTVSFVGDRGDGYGNTVEITHTPDNFLSKYSHMRCHSFLVAQDQVVTQGTPLGLVGGDDACRGTSFGSHIHFALARISDGLFFDPCQKMPNPAGGVFWDDNARAGPRSPISGHSNVGCPQCPQAAPSDVTTGPFTGLSQIVYSVTTSQGDASSKDCLAIPDIGKPKPGVNHIVSVALVNPTGAPLSRRFDIVFSPELGGQTATIESTSATVEEVQAALDAAIGAGNVVVTPAILPGHRGLFDE